MRCGVAPWMFEHINRHFEGRCAVEGWDEQDINEWLIGFTARRAGAASAGSVLRRSEPRDCVQPTWTASGKRRT